MKLVFSCNFSLGGFVNLFYHLKHFNVTFNVPVLLSSFYIQTLASVSWRSLYRVLKVKGHGQQGQRSWSQGSKFLHGSH